MTEEEDVDVLDVLSEDGGIVGGRMFIAEILKEDSVTAKVVLSEGMTREYALTLLAAAHQAILDEYFD